MKILIVVVYDDCTVRRIIQKISNTIRILFGDKQLFTSYNLSFISESLNITRQLHELAEDVQDILAANVSPDKLS